jgi:hypothetical protein
MKIKVHRRDHNGMWSMTASREISCLVLGVQKVLLTK